MIDRVISGYRVRFAQDAADWQSIQKLRLACFFPGNRARQRDTDDFDARCIHLMIEDANTGDLRACCRLLSCKGGADIAESYSATFYDLSRLAGEARGAIELGRFCTDPECRDTDVLRLLWGAVAKVVVERDAQLLFGCSSFPGLDPTDHEAALGYLGTQHAAPACHSPQVRSADVVRLGRGDAGDQRRKALSQMPPLLRFYISMGAWVSDHAVIDRDLQTIHVFTALDVAAIPARRQSTFLRLAS